MIATLRANFPRPLIAFGVGALTAGLVVVVMSLASARNARMPAVSPAQSARVFASELDARLRLADQALRALARDLETQASPSVQLGTTPRNFFDAVAVVIPGDAVVQGGGWAPQATTIDEATWEDLARGESVVMTAAEAGAPPRVLMARQLRRQGRTPRALMVALAPGYLWSRAPDSQRSQVCVRDALERMLFCSTAGLERTLAMQTMPATPAFGVLHEQGEAGGRVGYARFAITVSALSGHWTVLTAGSEPPLAQPMTAPTLGWAVGAGILTAAWVWRRAAGALRPVQAPPAKSPPQAPAASAAQRQRRTLVAMSEIDRAIMSGADSARLTVVAANYLLTCLDCDAVLVAAPENDVSVRMTVLHQEAASALAPIEQVTRDRVTLDQGLTERLARQPTGYWCDRLADFPLLAPLSARREISHALLLPLHQQSLPPGMVALGFTDGRELGTELAAYARALVDRLGVALTAAARAAALYNHVYVDATTNLSNRGFLKAHLPQQIARSRREHQRLALLFIDIDGFKTVNSAAGHDAGDVILAETGRRLTNALREEDLVVRFGGDEFVVVLPHIADPVNARKVATNLLQTLTAPFMLDGDTFHLGASIGISILPDDAGSIDELLRHADSAMFRAKTAGRGRFEFFDEEVNRIATERTRLEQDLRRAADKHEFVVFYQPQVDMRRGTLAGAEALVRWQRPQHGLVGPGDFIEIAEQSDVILQIGAQVLRAVCTQYQAWERDGIAPPRIAVNVACLELQRDGFVERVETILRETGMRPFALELEITEGSLLENSEHVIASLSRLRDRGIRVAIDDFGTGYSSLSYLKRLPVDVVKIDRSFVRDMESDADARALVSAIIDVAHNLGKTVVAEGIETQAQVALLDAQGCEGGQGYWWCHPLPASEFAQLCRMWPERLPPGPAVQALSA